MLTFEEFQKLPDREKEERYIELSDHDKFRVRISIPAIKISKGIRRELATEEKEFMKEAEELFNKNNK